MNIRAFREKMTRITRARHPIEIRHFVVGQHSDKWRQWYQLCIETDAKWAALEENESSVALALLEIEEREIKIRVIEASGSTGTDLELDQIEIKKLRVMNERSRRELERGNALVAGAVRELEDMARIAEEEFSEFFNASEDELVSKYERGYWVSRLARQIGVDMLTFGRVQAGNLECLLRLPDEMKRDVLIEGVSHVEGHNTLVGDVNKNLELDRMRKAIK
jgi:hypothetical protein